MHELLTLIYFEFRKIFKRKSTKISLIILFIFTLALGFGVSDINAARRDRECRKTLTGRTIDTKFLLEMQAAYSHINPDDAQYFRTKEFEVYVRPYNSLFWNIRQVYSLGNTNVIRQFLNLNEKDFNAFYTHREAKLLSDFNDVNLTEKEIQTHLKLNARLKTPLTYEPIGGYGTFLSFSTFYISFLVMFVTACCLAPIFAGEYSSNTAQIILPTKCRNKEILAKIITGAIFSIFMSIFYLSVYLLFWCIIYGFEGAGAPFQLIDLLSTYPITPLGSCIILILCSATANLLVTGLTLLLSSKFRTSFGVIVLTSLYIFIPQNIRVSPDIRVIYDIFSLFPTKMLDSNVFLGRYMYNIPGGPVLPYIFLPIFSIIVAFLLFFPAYHSFKGHQVG